MPWQSVSQCVFPNMHDSSYVCTRPLFRPLQDLYGTLLYLYGPPFQTSTGPSIPKPLQVPFSYSFRFWQLQGGCCEPMFWNCWFVAGCFEHVLWIIWHWVVVNYWKLCQWTERWELVFKTFSSSFCMWINLPLALGQVSIFKFQVSLSADTVIAVALALLGLLRLWDD